MTYQNLCDIYSEREKREQEEYRLLNSGFYAFEEWENRSVSSTESDDDEGGVRESIAAPSSEEELQFRDDIRNILDEAGQTSSWPPKPSNPTEADVKAKLQQLGWKSQSPFLVYGLEQTSDEGYKLDAISVDTLETKDKAMAELVSNVRDEHGHRMYFPTLLLFERQVHGIPAKMKKSTRTAKKKKSSSNNDEEIFFGYDNFAEIEIDRIKVCKWSPLAEEIGSWGYCSWLKEKEEIIVMNNILDEKGLRGMFVGKKPNKSDESSVTFYSAALALCPVANILRLNNTICSLGNTLSLLKDGGLVAPSPIKKDIAMFTKERTLKLTTRERFEKGSVFTYDLDLAIEIFMDAGCTSYILDLASTLITRVRELPNKEKDCSRVITTALIALTAPLFLTQQSAEKEQLCSLAKERLSYLIEATRNGEPSLTSRQIDAVFPASAKYSKQVQEFLESDLEKKEFGPFAIQATPSYCASEAEKWAKDHFGSHSIIGKWSGTSIEGEAAQNRGRYSANATVDVAKGKVTLDKQSAVVLNYKVDRYELHLAAREKLMPVFGKLLE